MFRRSEHKRRGMSPVYLLFRMVLSLIIFGLLLGGLYSAYKSFSGFDPLKLDSKAVSANFLSADSLQKITHGLIPASILAKLPISTGKSVIPQDNNSQSEENKNKAIKFSFLLVADSHSENNLLQKAISQSKQKASIKFIIGLGDYTEVGTAEELTKLKKELDSAGIRYFLVPGDHDLWDARDKSKPALENFTKVFGLNYQAFTYEGVKFILLDNSDIYKGLGETQIKWLNGELERIKQDAEVKMILVFIHKPLYHPSSEHVMGMEEPKLKDEAKNLSKLLKDNVVKEIFSGDIHFYTRYQDPTGFQMTTVGAVSTQRNPQNPRYAIVKVYEDLSYDVTDIEIK